MPKKKHLSATEFQATVLRWFDQHGRKTLPWQLDKTPYRVWVSEIMLQQTQVTTVIPYFQRFMHYYPNVARLAKASEDEILHLWTGLGYYSRARNLHKSAKKIMAEFQGIFPDTFALLESLPGVGRSTAGAILAIGFNLQAAILDGNVKRVLCRYKGIEKWPGEKKTHDQLWEIAETLTPQLRVADYTQAMMDLGATLCTRSKPNCLVCPLQQTCVAFTQDLTQLLPYKKPKAKIPTRYASFLLIENLAGQILLQKRPSTGIWGGLWSLPQLEGHVSHEEVKVYCRQQRFNIVTIDTGNMFRHTFSHFHLEVLPIYIKLKTDTNKICEANTKIWYNRQHPEAIGLPAPVKALLQTLSIAEVI